MKEGSAGDTGYLCPLGCRRDIQVRCQRYDHDTSIGYQLLSRFHPHRSLFWDVRRLVAATAARSKSDRQGCIWPVDPLLTHDGNHEGYRKSSSWSFVV
ncbi:hypothetical protein DIRU0_D24146 [Diutina rugosa]